MLNTPSAVPGQSVAPAPTMLTNPPPAPTLTVPPLPIGASPAVAMCHPPKTPQPQSGNPGNEQAPVVTPDGNTIAISSHINDLADAGYHIPLSLFTYESLCKLQNKHHSVKIMKIYQKNQKDYILNISQFPKEIGMCPLDWYLAWDPT
ncbi:hypothetical protein M404DRAFT_34392 [Pisolithus tinctorius Marx 270]|uniref:Uncharacterized protein n=1 Tax=Pisolithus tinctorius Marx 270 TaxID=870435 RepID=A0A0C3NHD7_PISTI|nr:hypothetical protein M404DRAFT_34392 [Pisolithus tinctorius Marx 270]